MCGPAGFHHDGNRSQASHPITPVQWPVHWSTGLQSCFLKDVSLGDPSSKFSTLLTQVTLYYHDVNRSQASPSTTLVLSSKEIPSHFVFIRGVSLVTYLQQVTLAVLPQQEQSTSNPPQSTELHFAFIKCDCQVMTHIHMDIVSEIFA